NEKALVDPDRPLGADNVLTDADLTNAKTYGHISPRVGIGFPVTPRTMLHVNWGQFYQQPNFQDLYVSYRFLAYKVQTGGYYVPFGNPNLKPEMTTAYEVGLSHQLNDFSKFDVSVYYKSVKDAVQLVNVPSVPYSLTAFRNVGSATLKGVDLGFTLRPVNHFNASLGYSLLFAQVTRLVPNPVWSATPFLHRTSRLDFDQRHKVTVNLG